jgi:hypothetical protein
MSRPIWNVSLWLSTRRSIRADAPGPCAEIILGFVLAKSLQSAGYFAYNPPHLHNPDGRRLEPAFDGNEGDTPRKEVEE